MPFPMRIKGTDRVNANEPRTLSIENEASMASRYMIFDQSDMPVLRSFFSAASACCLNPCVMKKTVEPSTAANSRVPLRVMAKPASPANRIDATA